MSSFVLKILACFFMLIDHIGFALFPNVIILRVIGRLAFPIFAFQVSIGYSKTKSKEKYILRMLLFTIISQVPFYLFERFSLDNSPFIINVGAILTCGLLAIYCFDKIKTKWLKYVCIVFIILLSIIIPMDYSGYGVLIILVFYIFKDDKLGLGVFYSVLVISYCIYKQSIFNLPAIYALLPILLFNGKRGKNVKYLFYSFYPLHLLIIVFVKNFLL